MSKLIDIVEHRLKDALIHVRLHPDQDVMRDFILGYGRPLPRYDDHTLENIDIHWNLSGEKHA